MFYIRSYAVSTGSGVMGYNVSRNRRIEMVRRRRMAELEPYLVPGWQLDPDGLRIVTVDTALSFYQRGQELLLRCQRADCRRRVEVDVKQAMRAGLGDKPTAHLVELLRCRHWAECRLQQVSAIYPHGVPLVAYLDDEDVVIEVKCEKCGYRLLLPPEAMIDRLIKAGRGDGSTGIHSLGKAVRGPCRKCGGRQFKADVIRPKAPGTCSKTASNRTEVKEGRSCLLRVSAQSPDFAGHAPVCQLMSQNASASLNSSRCSSLKTY